MKSLPRHLAALLLAPCLATAAPLVLGDPSFEGNSLTVGNWTNNLGPEWQETNGPNNPNGFEERIAGFAADGTDHLGMQQGHNVWQDTGHVYEADTLYTLTVAIGNRSGGTEPGNQSIYSLADDQDIIYATGSANASLLPVATFSDAPPVTLNTALEPGAVGKPIRILLQAGGTGRSHFDHVRLDAVPFIPEGTATLQVAPATGVTAEQAVLHGTVTNPGTSAPEVTFFWGPVNGGVNPAAWEFSETLPGTVTGSFSTTAGGLSPGSTWHFTARATNGSGSSWAPVAGSFETPANPPVVQNDTAGDITPTGAVVGVWVPDTGGNTPQVTIYHGPTDGGTNPSSWASSVSLGEVENTGMTPLTGLPMATTWFYRAYAVNSGGGSWAPATDSFSTATATPATVLNHPAEGISGSTANLRGEVTATGGDTPVVTIFYGTADGGTDASAWASSVSPGAQGGAFNSVAAGLAAETTYFFRVRAVNAAGASWAAESGTFTTTNVIQLAPVINEFHFKPQEKTSLEEFIELHNPGDTTLDLTGWSITDAVTYSFPAGTTIAPGGYLVIGEAPPVLLAKYGVTALGPWTGKLNSTGERIELRDASNAVRDRVEYGVGFPWPTGSDGAGSSAELLHPSLDNDLGGSWRASGTSLDAAVQYIGEQATGWRYRKGTAEASSPVDAWRSPAFNDSGWLTGQAGFGYGAYTGHNTVLGDMQGNYTSAYFRKSFTISADAVPAQVQLRMRVDDGYIVWINGREVARRYIGNGQIPYNATATNHTREWESFTISNDDLLYGGTNVIAVHALNTTRNSSDFSFDMTLAATTPPAVPTPGAPNSVRTSASHAPPAIRQVAHSPLSPAPGQAVTVTAKLTDPDGMGAVSLAYQLVDPGGYIRLNDPAYAANWTTVPMRDDGGGGDALAGDGVYTAILPASLQVNRRLVRYRIAFADVLGNAATAPYGDDEQPNFAYYVYSGLPAWQGAFRPGTTPLQTFFPELLDDLPVYTLVANGTDVINSQYSGGSDAVRFRGTFVHKGVVYDHIEFKNRGEASTYVSGKNKWRFFFNRARDLPAADNFGRPYAETWGSFSGDACASPWAALHRGMAGVEEATSYKAFQLGGVPSPNTHYYHFRIVRDATETPPAGTTVSNPIGTGDGQYAGDFWGLYLAVEQPDGSFLDERGLPDGSVYKIEGNSGDKKSQGVTFPVDSSDWDAFRDAHVNANPSEAWWRQNMDMEAYYTFHAISRLTGNVDLRGGYNHYFYHRSSDNRWVPMPWDLDMMFIAKSHWTTGINGTNYPGVIHAHKSVLQNPALALEYRNRARELLDLLAGDGNAGGGQIGQLIDEHAAIVNPAGQALTWADADAAMWNLHPRTQGSDSSPNGQTNHRGNFYRASFSDDRMGGSWTRWLRAPGTTGTMEHEDSMAYLRDYATNTWLGSTWTVNNGNQAGYGYQYLASEAQDPAIPGRPTITVTGDPTFPVSDLTFTASTFTDPQGPGTRARTHWRLAEISGPGVPGYVTGTPRKYEIHPTWQQDTAGEAATLTIPLGVAQPGRTYRVRVRHQDNTGRWSRWSEAATFLATEPQAGELVHYWNFDGETATDVTRTTGGGLLSWTATGGAAITTGTGQSFNGENAREEEGAGVHLRVNNPLGATLTFALPSTGHRGLIAKYETRRSGQGAGLQQVSYTVDGTTWVPFTTLTVVDDTPVVQVLDFRGIPAVEDNPLFAVRIAFATGAGSNAGNNRFDNFTLEGEQIPVTPGTYAHWRQENFDPAARADDAISGPAASTGGVSNLLRYALGLAPGDAVEAHLPRIATVEGDGAPVRQFRFRYDPSLTDIRWKVVATTTLDAWPATLLDSATDPVPPPADGWSAVTLPASLTGSTDPDPRIFARLEVTLKP